MSEVTQVVGRDSEPGCLECSGCGVFPGFRAASNQKTQPSPCEGQHIRSHQAPNAKSHRVFAPTKGNPGTPWMPLEETGFENSAFWIGLGLTG